MKSEVRDMNKALKDRVKEIDEQILKFKGANDELMKQGQELQQSLAQNNTEIIKLQGGKEELEKQLVKK